MALLRFDVAGQRRDARQLEVDLRAEQDVVAGIGEGLLAERCGFPQIRADPRSELCRLGALLARG
jgi:hypothetical protein